MFGKKDYDKITFRGVALLFILVGAGLLAFGLVEWILNLWYVYSFVSPSAKFIGGALIAGVGYIILELELLRRK